MKIKSQIVYPQLGIVDEVEEEVEEEEDEVEEEVEEEEDEVEEEVEEEEDEVSINDERSSNDK